MKQLILVGAGAWGLEVWSWLESSIGHNETFLFKGFLDSEISGFDEGHFCDAKILGTSRDYIIQSNDVFVCTIGDPKAKQNVVLDLISRGAEFINLIHDSVLLFNNIKLGLGIIISPNCVISNGSHIKSHVSINLFCSIGHDTEIGEFSVISSHSDITGYVIIADGVFLGSSVSIIPKIVIAQYSRIGAGAVVMRSIKKTGTYVGNPAKKLGNV
jgi:sugar O-acyltransferase (sialic acid O-acetyltransferase NeuD family)